MMQLSEAAVPAKCLVPLAGFPKPFVTAAMTVSDVSAGAEWLKLRCCGTVVPVWTAALSGAFHMKVLTQTKTQGMSRRTDIPARSRCWTPRFLPGLPRSHLCSAISVAVPLQQSDDERNRVIYFPERFHPTPRSHAVDATRGHSKSDKGEKWIASPGEVSSASAATVSAA